MLPYKDKKQVVEFKESFNRYLLGVFALSH